MPLFSQFSKWHHLKWWLCSQWSQCCHRCMRGLPCKWSSSDPFNWDLLTNISLQGCYLPIASDQHTTVDEIAVTAGDEGEMPVDSEIRSVSICIFFHYCWFHMPCCRCILNTAITIVMSELCLHCLEICVVKIMFSPSPKYHKMKLDLDKCQKKCVVKNKFFIFQILPSWCPSSVTSISIL